MNAEQLEIIEAALRTHIETAITYLYKLANVGDNLLELGKYSIEYSDGANYNVTAICMDFERDPNGILVFYQQEEKCSETENYEITILETNKMLELLPQVGYKNYIHLPTHTALQPYYDSY